MVEISANGPVFEGRINIKAAQRGAMARANARAEALARGLLRQRSRYSTPKYGHAADQIRSRIETVAGTADQTIGKVFIGGPAAFLAPWLEFGTKAHPIPDVRERTHRGRTTLNRKVVTLPILTGAGLLFRASADHRGARAFRWASITQEQINREAPKIFERAYADATKAP
jgi:hypothetical protein